MLEYYSNTNTSTFVYFVHVSIQKQTKTCVLVQIIVQEMCCKYCGNQSHVKQDIWHVCGELHGFSEDPEEIPLLQHTITSLLHTQNRAESLWFHEGLIPFLISPITTKGSSRMLDQLDVVEAGRAINTQCFQWWQYILQCPLPWCMEPYRTGTLGRPASEGDT